MLSNLLNNQSNNLLNSGLFGGNSGQQQQGNQVQNQQGGGLLGNTLSSGLFGGNNNSSNQNQSNTGLLGGLGMNGGSNVSNPLLGGNNKGNQQGGAGLMGGLLGNSQGNANQNAGGQNQQGGLFGGLTGSNNQQQTGGGLLGGSLGGNNQTNNGLMGGGNNNGTSGGLFGSNNGGGLMGSNNGGGLLGSANNGGGLLGSNGNSGTGGLLGGMGLGGGNAGGQTNNNSLGGGSGLLGGNSTGNQGSGLLNNQVGGLLGQGQAQNQQKGGLFNNGSTQQQGLGLLNSTGAQQQGANSSTGGLFNSLQQPQGNNSNANAKGGLFQNQAGGQGNQTGATQNTGAGGGLFQNLNQGGAGGQGLLQQQQKGATNATGGANTLQQGQGSALNSSQTQSNPQLFEAQMPDFYNMQMQMQMMNQFMSMMQNRMNVPQPTSVPQQMPTQDNSSSPRINRSPSPLPEPASYSLKSLGGKISESFRSQDFSKSIFSHPMKYNIQYYNGAKKPENNLKRSNISSKLSQRNHSLLLQKSTYKPNRESLQFMFKRSEEEENYRTSHRSSTKSNQISVRYSKNSPLGFNEAINLREMRDINQTIEINVSFNDTHEFGRQHNNLYRVKSTTNSKIYELKRRAIEKIFGERQNAGKEFALVYRGTTLQEERSISDYNLRENDSIELVIGGSEQNSMLNLSGKKVRKETLAPEEMVPKLTKKGYRCEPSLTKMFRMNEEELSSIKNFTIFNEFGKLTFEEPVDLRGVNLDEIITITHKTVEVYPENYENIPKSGEGLNKPATVVFYQWGVPQKYSGSIDEYQGKLKRWAGSIQAQFVYFKPEKQEVSIRITSF